MNIGDNVQESCGWRRVTGTLSSSIKKASSQRRHNLIKGLYDHNGDWQDSDARIEHVVTQYFSDIFSAGIYDMDHMRAIVDLIPSCVTEEMNSDLIAPYFGEEIRTALFQMHPNKSPGPDGFSPLFYQRYWEEIGPDIVLAVQNFLQTGEFLKEINYTHVCLIPKSENPQEMSQLRPIALCNVIYKICAKVLANRLKKILPMIISPYQSAFVPGRLITDNTLVAN